MDVKEVAPMSTDASTGREAVPRASHRPSRRGSTPTPSFSERRPLTGSLLTVCVLVGLGLAVGTALGKVLVMVAELVLGVITPGAGK